MCGRYTTNTEEELIEIKDIIKDIVIRLENEDKKDLGKEVFPSCKAPVINGEKELKLMHWGYTKWDNSGLIFNARSEGLEKSKFFAYNQRNNRCIIPAKEYFEWEKKDNSKIKHCLKSIDNDIIFFAGLMKKDEQDNYVIITKNADKEISFIHERMPVVMNSEIAQKWLSGEYSINDIINNTIKVQ